MDKDICRRVRELRRSMKLTQSQFAELVDLSEDSIGKIERGATVPKMDTLSKIAKGLNMPIEDLLRPRKTSPKRPSRAMDDLVAYLSTRSPEDVKFIHELAVRILERKK